MAITSVNESAALQQYQKENAAKFPRTSKLSKDERLEFAKSKGLSGDLALQFANSNRQNTYNDTFWDRFAKFFGGKLGSEKFQESLDLQDDALLNELLNAQREQEYNSPEAQAERMRAAGINPDLGQSSLEAGEASQIDDEVLGTGLNESLASAQTQASELPLQVASGIMDAAGALFGLVSSGIDISTKLYDLEAKEMSDVFNLSKSMNDLGSFLPLLGIGYDDVNKTFVDKNGALTLEQMSDKTRDYIMRQQANYIHPRSRRKVRQLFSNFKSSKALESYYASKTGAKKQTLDYAKAGEGLAQLAGNAGVSLESLLTSEPYKATCDLAAELYNMSLQAKIQEETFNSQYYSALNSTDQDGYTGGEDKAAHDRLEQQVSQYRSSIKKQVLEKMTEWVSKLSSNDDAISRLLLMSAMSGGMQDLGFGSPFDLIDQGLDRVGDMAEFITDLFFPKGIVKGAVKGAAKGAKAVKQSAKK